MSPTRWAVLAAIVAGVALLVVLNFVLVDDPEPRRAAERCDQGDLPCYENRYAELVEDDGAKRALRSSAPTTSATRPSARSATASPT